MEGDKWNEKGFKWWELVKKGTDMGFLNGGFINVGIRVPVSQYRHYSCSHLSITDFVDEHPKRKRFVQVNVVGKGLYLGDMIESKASDDPKKAGEMERAYLILMTKIARHLGANLKQASTQMKKAFDLLLLITKASRQDTLVLGHPFYFYFNIVFV